MDTCLNCGGAIGEPGVAYGYAGKWCHCAVNPSSKYQRPSKKEIFGIELKDGEGLSAAGPLKKESGYAYPTPTARDVEKARVIYETIDASDHGCICAPERLVIRAFSKALAAERASLPESVIDNINRIAQNTEEHETPRQLAKSALADLRRWQKDGPEPRKDI